MRFVKVAVPGVPEPLDYLLPEEFGGEEGRVVFAPLREDVRAGVIVGSGQAIEGAKPLYSETPYKVPPELLELARWVSDYYLSPFPEALRLVMPPLPGRPQRVEVRVPPRPERIPGELRGRVQRELYRLLWERKGRWLSVRWLKRQLGPSAADAAFKLASEGFLQLRVKHSEPKPKEIVQFMEGGSWVPPTPTPEQAAALEELGSRLAEGFQAALLYGATGSGKTAVYIWLAERALAFGKGVMVLVPEISLTPQLARTFRAALGDEVVVYHSAFSQGERLWAWQEVAEGRKRVVLGTRSALFLPVRDLGLLVVDEEHDPSYKEHQAPRYHARDLAAVRAKMAGALLILGSATPSAESFYNAKRGKYVLVRMRRRVPGYSWPRVKVVDLRRSRVSGIISHELLERLREITRAGYQAILFLNRRGYAPALQCPRCGFVKECPACSVSMTYHKDTGLLVCHLCGRTERPPDACPRCGYPMRPIFYGVQRVVENLRHLLPGVSVGRLDADVARRRGGAEELFEGLRAGRIQVLVGTQLVTKGLDLPRVKLVGVLLADLGLYAPDFRASERTAQLLWQVAGRVRTGGEVIVQTLSPEERSVKAMAAGDYDSFILGELAERHRLGYPPFKRLLLLEAADRDPQRAEAKLLELRARLEEIEGLEILGPAPAPHFKVNNLYRYRLLIKRPRKFNMAKLDFLKYERGVKVDVDPVE